MVGELYKTKMGWAVKFPIMSESKKIHFSLNVFPVDNQDKLTDVNLGQIVSFSVKFKKNKGNFPYAEIDSN